MAVTKEIPIREIDTTAPLGHANLPTEAEPGISSPYPTCSEPSSKNKGCDAWGKCTTKGQGPYAVAFINPKGRKTSTHCRNWMYKFQFNPKYMAQANDLEECVEEVANDPLDKKKGTHTEHYYLRIQNVKKPENIRREANNLKINPDLVDGPQSNGNQVEARSEDTTQQEPKAPVEGIKRGYRRKNDQSDSAGG